MKTGEREEVPKKKFPIYTLVVVTPRHSIKLNDRVVSVVEKAPIANAVYFLSFSFLEALCGMRTYRAT